MYDIETVLEQPLVIPGAVELTILGGHDAHKEGDEHPPLVPLKEELLMRFSMVLRAPLRVLKFLR